MKVIYTGTREPSASGTELAGIELVHLPMLERVALPLPNDVAHELGNVERVHRHVAFYSQNAVEVVLEGLGADAFDGVQFWAVGEQTAEAIESAFGRPALSPDKQDFVGLTEMLRRTVRGGDLVVSFELSGGERRLDEMSLPAKVLSVATYDTRPTHWDDLDGLLRRIGPRWVIFASPRAFEAFRDNLHHRVVGDSYRVAAIGPTTRDAIQRSGDRVDLTPGSPDLAALLREIVAHS